ncbi:hypothetical protein GE061_010908, partial [Apolygus lucorum]
RTNREKYHAAFSRSRLEFDDRAARNRCHLAIFTSLPKTMSVDLTPDHTSSPEYEIPWTKEADVILLNSVLGLRPLGRQREPAMQTILSRFIDQYGKKVSMDTIENRIKNFYNFEDVRINHFIENCFIQLHVLPS